MNAADLSIIIVNWNSVAYTTACIASIQSTVTDVQYEIIVVDNGSSDNSVELLERVAGIRVIASPDNLGFARANNLGYEHATGTILLFLNPDTKVHDGAISRMRTAVMSSDAIGIVGCRLLNADDSLQTSCVQSFPTILNQLMDVEALKMRFPLIRMWGIRALFETGRDISQVEAISGACLMIRRSLFESVGLFDTEYFMYCEDVDLCFMAAGAGYQIGYVAGATVTHYGGQSSKQATQSSFATVMGREAIYKFFAKRRGNMYAKVYSCTMFFSASFRLVVLLLWGLLSPGGERKAITSRREKWWRILNWSVGRESWARQLRASACNPAPAVNSPS